MMATAYSKNAFGDSNNKISPNHSKNISLRETLSSGKISSNNLGSLGSKTASSRGRTSSYDPLLQYSDNSKRGARTIVRTSSFRPSHQNSTGSRSHTSDGSYDSYDNGSPPPFRRFISHESPKLTPKRNKAADMESRFNQSLHRLAISRNALQPCLDSRHSGSPPPFRSFVRQELNSRNENIRNLKENSNMNRNHTSSIASNHVYDKRHNVLTKDTPISSSRSTCSLPEPSRPVLHSSDHNPSPNSKWERREVIPMDMLLKQQQHLYESFQRNKENCNEASNSNRQSPHTPRYNDSVRLEQSSNTLKSLYSNDRSKDRFPLSSKQAGRCFNDQEYVSGRDRNCKMIHRPDSFSKPSHTTQSDVKFLEVCPGISMPLRGASETFEAVQNDFYIPQTCSCCQSTIFCIQDAEYVLCPICKSICPIDEEQLDYDRSNHGLNKGGIGLGFDLETLHQFQNQKASFF